MNGESVSSTAAEDTGYCLLSCPGRHDCVCVKPHGQALPSVLGLIACRMGKWAQAQALWADDVNIFCNEWKTHTRVTLKSWWLAKNHGYPVQGLLMALKFLVQNDLDRIYSALWTRVRNILIACLRHGLHVGYAMHPVIEASPFDCWLERMRDEPDWLPEDVCLAQDNIGTLACKLQAVSPVIYQTWLFFIPSGGLCQMDTHTCETVEKTLH